MRNTKKYLIFTTGLFLSIAGCQTAPTVKTRTDGLYVNYQLVKANATVEDFCLAKGGVVELVSNKKVRYSKEK